MQHDFFIQVDTLRKARIALVVICPAELLEQAHEECMEECIRVRRDCHPRCGCARERE